MYDSKLASFTALVIDDSDMARSVLAGMLREAGVRSVSVARDPEQARRLLQGSSFDLILCDYYYDGCSETGQDFLDELRSVRGLPFRTVFIMITGEARYERVAGVVEHAPDDYLLKPIKSATLIERLKATIRRKAALIRLYDHRDHGRYDEALAAGDAMIAARSPYRLSAARLCAEICLQRNDFDRAAGLYQLALEQHETPWARLGIAQIAYARNDRRQAQRALESLLSEHERYGDAYDLLARIQTEAGDLTAALETLRRAATAAPANVGRLQRLGVLAFLLGESAAAETALERAMRLDTAGRAFDFQSLVTLAFLRLDRGAAARKLERLLSPLEQSLSEYPESFRVQALLATARACAAIARADPDHARAQLRELLRSLRQPGFDFEAGCNTLAPLVRLPRHGVELTGAADAAATIAQRFCVSRTATALLLACAGNDADLRDCIEREQTVITHTANDAMAWVVRGKIGRAVRQLLEAGRQTLNARLLSLATGLAHRHPDGITAATRGVIDEADALRRQYCSYGTHVALASTAVASQALLLQDPVDALPGHFPAIAAGSH